MAIRTYKVTLDTKNAIAPEPVYLRQGDKTGAVVIDATLMDNGSPVSLSGLTPMFKANTADGQAVIADSTGFNIIDASGGEFTYQVPNALSSVPGKIVTAYFSFSDSSGSESTFDVAFVIKKAVDITQAQADDYIAIIDGTIRDLKTKVDAIYADFSAGNFYNKNQVDTLNNYLKKSISDSEKSSKSYVDNKVSILSNGAPKAVSQVSSMTDKTKNYVYTGTEPGYTPGNWYYWSGSMWISGGTYQAVGIGDKTVTTSKLADSSVIPSKTNFISKDPKNINLFDKNSQDNWFGKVVNAAGSIEILSDWNYSHSIPCKPGDMFIVGTTSKKSDGYAGLFNGEKWVSNVPNMGGYLKVPTNVTVTSIRFAIKVSIFESTMIFLMPHELPKAYIPFSFLLDDQIKLDYANLENVSVGENDVTFLSKNQGSNKFDLNNTSPNIIDENKIYGPLNGYVSTNDISVKNGDVVSWNFNGYGWVLDSQKNPIEFMPLIASNENSHTISNINASFVRIAIPTNDVATGMVTINEPIPTVYQPFRSSYELADNITINESNVIKSPISGKTVSIVGDSYSAYTGWVPEGYNISYDGTYNGVTSVTKMWWYKVIKNFNMSLMLNESWSGSTICNTGYNAADATATSFLTRITKRYGAKNTLGQKPQVLFILGGLNDTWAKSPLGSAKYSDWTTDDLKTTLGAYSKMINDILLYNPGIEIINFEYAAVSQAIRDGKALICEHFGVKNVPISVVDSWSGHPTTKGMQQIVDQIITALNV